MFFNSSLYFHFSVIHVIMSEGITVITFNVTSARKLEHIFRSQFVRRCPAYSIWARQTIVATKNALYVDLENESTYRSIIMLFTLSIGAPIKGVLWPSVGYSPKFGKHWSKWCCSYLVACLTGRTQTVVVKPTSLRLWCFLSIFLNNILVLKLDMTK